MKATNKKQSIRNIIIFAILVNGLGWLGPVLPPIVWFTLKTAFFVCAFILLRASLPRPRYDQLMSLGWKILLPLSLAEQGYTYQSMIRADMQGQMMEPFLITFDPAKG